MRVINAQSPAASSLILCIGTFALFSSARSKIQSSQQHKQKVQDSRAHYLDGSNYRLHQVLRLENMGFQQYITLNPWSVDPNAAYKRYKAAEVEMLPDQRKFKRSGYFFVGAVLGVHNGQNVSLEVKAASLRKDLDDSSYQSSNPSFKSYSK
ncbi:hypothetical protein PENSUB_2042 [Penicillium subrubescens]|uniref:Uncharacterized protein n=1 Tax=Penicillium subrubescens TaxID=1316194 RepID=A0A1Q5UIK0_9EURO|nr:hypothetical protein PENSUB_2042 [Penicillium subrubescens]